MGRPTDIFTQSKQSYSEKVVVLLPGPPQWCSMSTIYPECTCKLSACTNCLYIFWWSSWWRNVHMKTGRGSKRRRDMQSCLSSGCCGQCSQGFIVNITRLREEEFYNNCQVWVGRRKESLRDSVNFKPQWLLLSLLSPEDLQFPKEVQMR